MNSPVALRESDSLCDLAQPRSPGCLSFSCTPLVTRTQNSCAEPCTAGTGITDAECVLPRSCLPSTHADCTARASCLVTARHLVSCPHTAHTLASLARSARLAFRAAAFMPENSRLCCISRYRQPLRHCSSRRRQSRRAHGRHLRPLSVRRAAPPCQCN